MKRIKSGRQSARREVSLGPRSEVPKHRSNKDTRRWCKGVPGREHVLGFKEWRPRSDLTEEYCTKCGRSFGLVGSFFLSTYGPAF